MICRCEAIDYPLPALPAAFGCALSTLGHPSQRDASSSCRTSPTTIVALQQRPGPDGTNWFVNCQALLVMQAGPNTTTLALRASDYAREEGPHSRQSLQRASLAGRSHNDLTPTSRRSSAAAQMGQSPRRGPQQIEERIRRAAGPPLSPSERPSAGHRSTASNGYQRPQQAPGRGPEMYPKPRRR